MMNLHSYSAAFPPSEAGQPAPSRARTGICLVAVMLLSMGCASSGGEPAGAADSASARTVKRIYKAFENGDLDTILGLMADDVTWIHPGPEAIPFAGTFHGKEGVKRFFDTAIATLDVLDQRVKGLLVDGDTVAALGFERMRVKTTGQEYQSDWIHLYTLRDGKIARFEEYIDTAMLAESFGSPE